MINNYNELNNEINMLDGNINRMCLVDNMKELDYMYQFALLRIKKIYEYNLNRVLDKVDKEFRQNNSFI